MFSEMPLLWIKRCSLWPGLEAFVFRGPRLGTLLRCVHWFQVLTTTKREKKKKTAQDPNTCMEAGGVAFGNCFSWGTKQDQEMTTNLVCSRCWFSERSGNNNLPPLVVLREPTRCNPSNKRAGQGVGIKKVSGCNLVK